MINCFMAFTVELDLNVKGGLPGTYPMQRCSFEFLLLSLLPFLNMKKNEIILCIFDSVLLLESLRPFMCSWSSSFTRLPNHIPVVICTNELCGASLAAGDDFINAWPLRSGDFAKLCGKCG